MSSLISGTVSTLTGAALNPYLSGALLYGLTRGPEPYRSQLLERIRQLPFRVDIAKTVTALKWLLALGVVGKANGYLNALALNAWRISSRKSQWTWDKEVAVVTGGCSGIGEQMVRKLIKKGTKVVVVDVQPLPAAMAAYADIYHYSCDVTDPDAVASTTEEIQSKFGFVSILINNAGIGTIDAIVDTSPTALQKIFGVNILSHFYLCKAFLPEMAARNKGHIISIASTASFITVPGMADYCATKAGVLAFHETLNLEIKQKHKSPDVITTVVHPNWTRTPLTEQHRAHLEKNQGPLLTADEVAEAIVQQIWSCRGGQLILPKWVRPVSTIRSWPNWMQEALRDLMGREGLLDVAEKPVSK